MKAALSGSVISALAIGGLVAVAATVGVVADPSPPAAEAATGLRTFQDCAALKAWYVDHTIDQVGAYGWGGRGWTTMAQRAAGPDTAAQGEALSGSVPTGSTGTNTQEAGVDEPDVAKTDGRIVVRLVEDRKVVITDVTGATPRDLATWAVPAKTFVDGLLLVGDHVLLGGDRPTFMLDDLGGGPAGTTSGVIGSGGSQLIDLDISDPSHPRMDSSTTWSGKQLSMRQYGDTVRLVTSTGLPGLAFVQPRAGLLTEDQAKERNRQIVRDSTVEQWLPGLTSGIRSGPLVGCDDVFHPATWSGSDTVAVATFHPGAVGSASAVAVTGAGSEVYSSNDRLYVTATDWGQRLTMPRPLTDNGQTTPQRSAISTTIHAFALDGASTRYVASGTVQGSIRDRWSLDEHDRHLRVAVSWPAKRDQAGQNGIVVLEEKDGKLEQVGELRGLGVDEAIQSVRWFDDLAVIVTFRQTDPLYTVDLSDPTQPRTLGELKLPGFSSYLHPIGDGRLLGLGTDATTQGRGLGAQAGVFDVSDPARAQQVGRVTFGEQTYLRVSDDPHAFTWLPDANAAITSLEDGSRTGSAVVLLRVSATGALTREDLPSPGGWQPRALPLQDGRVALVGQRVLLVPVS